MESYENLLIIKSGFEYIERMLAQRTDKEVSDFYDNPKNNKQIDMITDIMAVEVAYYICRRTVSIDDSVVHPLGRMRFRMIKAYEKKYGTWLDFNKNVDF